MSLIYSPSHQLLVYEIKDNIGNIQQKVIGNATNIIVNTTRGKTPIFAFGSAEAKAIIRGFGFIEGSIDMVQFDKDFINEYLQSHNRIITPIEKKYTYSEIVEDNKETTVFGNTIEYAVAKDQNIDDINFDTLSLIAANPKADDEGTYKYLKVTLYNVQFYDYSYAKSINDVTQLERISFLAQKITPVQTINFEA